MNPFHPNYLNQINFNNKPNKPGQKRQLVEPSSHKKQFNNLKMSSRQIKASFPTEMNRVTNNLIYTSQGYMLAFTKIGGDISGRSQIIFPDGIVANCNIINGKVCGWATFCKKNVFYNISHFSKNIFDGPQYTYDIGCGLTVQSIYRMGKIQSIKQGFAESKRSFEKCLKNPQLVELISSTLSGQYFLKNFPNIKSSLGSFCGQMTNRIPNGVGVLITQKELFYGQFKRGLLNGQGTIVFQNGDYYIGQFQQGMMKGIGNLSKNSSSSYKYYDIIISQSQFQQLNKVQRLDNIQEVSGIFDSIIKFYLKLSQIYHRKKQTSQEDSISFVDIQLQNSEQKEYQEKQVVSSSKSQSANSEIIVQQIVKQTVDKKSNVKLSNSKMEPKKTEKQSKEKKQLVQDQEINNLGTTIKKRTILNEHEWQEIIEQLEGQQSINREDGFLQPNHEKKQSDQQFSLKKNPINARINNREFINNKQIKIEDLSNLEDKLIGKITKK